IQQPLQLTPENSPISSNVSVDRLFKFDKIKELHTAGRSILSIAKRLKVHRDTIRKYIKQDIYQARVTRRSTNFDAFIQILFQENNQNKSWKELFQIIKQMGFKGKYTQFCFNMNA